MWRGMSALCMREDNAYLIRSLHGHVDFLGTGALSVKEEVSFLVRSGPRKLMIKAKFQPTVLANEHVNFVILSDVWLDHPRTMSALQMLFEGYAAAAEERPMLFVLCGNFAQKGWEGQGGLKRYTSQLYRQSNGHVELIAADGFNALADLIASFPLLAQSHFVFVPGPTDPWTSNALPRPALPTAFTSRLTSKVPKARFVSNPCRLRYFGQEIVVCREDLMARMVRNLVTVKEGEEVDMKRYVSFPSFIALQAYIAVACTDHPGPSAPIASTLVGPPNAVGVRPRPATVPHADGGGPRGQI